MTVGRRAPACGLILVASALLLSACGTSADEEARRLRAASVIAKDDPIQRFVVRRSAIGKARRGSAERAFLQYWSDLQFQAWPSAARMFEPGLRRLVGDDVLIRALANQAAAYRASRPDVVSATTRGDRALVRYLRIGIEGTAPASSSWRRYARGRWLISYDPLLDQALADLRQRETQERIDPLAQRPVPEAIRAASEARRIQSLYAARRRASAGPPRP
jgi:hypothetical protein